MENELTPEEVAELKRQRKNAYAREWRRRNPSKQAEYTERHYRRKMEREQAERECYEAVMEETRESLRAKGIDID